MRRNSVEESGGAVPEAGTEMITDFAHLPGKLLIMFTIALRINPIYCRGLIFCVYLQRVPNR